MAVKMLISFFWVVKPLEFVGTYVLEKHSIIVEIIHIL
jgi:hypothetical protein